MDIRVVTINLSGVGDGWFEGRRKTLVSGLADLDPDVVCMQEVASRGSPYPYDQVQDLSRRTGLNFACFAPYGNVEELKSRERGGLAILARWPFRMVEALKLPAGPVPPDERVAVLGSLAHPDGEVHIVNLHLSWQIGEANTRDRQAEHLMSRLHDLWLAKPGDRLVVAGDLNGEEGEPALARMRQSLKDTYRDRHPTDPGYSWAHANPLVWHPAPDRRLDYVFTDPEAAVIACELAFTEPEAPASDHYGVFAQVRWPSR